MSAVPMHKSTIAAVLYDAENAGWLSLNAKLGYADARRVIRTAAYHAREAARCAREGNAHRAVDHEQMRDEHIAIARRMRDGARRSRKSAAESRERARSVLEHCAEF